MLTWLDVLALFSMAVTTAVGARKGAVFLFVFLVALALYVVLIEWLPPWSWPLLGLGAGLLAAQVVGRLGFFITDPNLDMLFGALGGLLWGSLLALGLWTGLPAQYSVATGSLRYPSPDLPVVIQDAVRESPFALKLFDFVQREPLIRRLFLSQSVEEALFTRLSR